MSPSGQSVTYISSGVDVSFWVGTVCSRHGRKSLLDVIEKRIDVLDSLLADGKDKRELVGELDCSRSTVDRSVRELEAAGVVEYADGEYRTTTFGRLATEEYREFERRVETMERLEPVLEWLPVDEFDLDFGCLADAELVVSTPADPYAPANHHADVMAESESFRGLLPAVGLNQLEVGQKAVLGTDRKQTLVVDAGVAEQLRSTPHYAETIDDLLASGRWRSGCTRGRYPTSSVCTTRRSTSASRTKTGCREHSSKPTPAK